jgi:hypothetical protein
MFPTATLAQDHSHDAVGFEGKVLLKTTVTATDQLDQAVDRRAHLLSFDPNYKLTHYRPR